MKRPKHPVVAVTARRPLPPGRPASQHMLKQGPPPPPPAAKPGKGGKPKPVRPVPAAVRHARHKAAMKAARTRAANAAKAKKLAKRGLPLGELLACCAAEALGMSLRLAGGVVTAADIEALYWLTAGDPDEGAPVLATLEAAAAHGLAGVRPVAWAPAGRGPLLLGLALPEGPHCVLADGGDWWSWGLPWPPSAFPGAVVEEAWAVTW